MSKKPAFTVKSKKYHFFLDVQHSDFLLMNRVQNYQKDQSVIDAYGELWIFAFADLAPNQLFIRDGDTSIPLVGSWGIFIGDYSLIEWQVKKGGFSWQAVTSFKKELPIELKGKVFLVPWNKEAPKNIDDLFDHICNSPGRIEIEPQRKSSAVALKTKKYIDKNYFENSLIKTVAEELNLSWAVMTREFKKSYGISPIEYRHKLRVFKALKELSSGVDVTKALSESGFTSASQFFIQFKKHLGVTPNNYHYDSRLFS